MAIVLDGTNGIIVSGNTNSFSGVYVGEGNGALDTNTAVGRLVLSFNSTGGANSGFGQNALALNTTGSYNSGFGRNTLQASSTGSSNTAVGESALYSNSTADNNTAVGYQAGYTNTTAQFSTFIGAASGYATTGERNTFVGQGSGTTNSSGTYNTFIGQYSGGDMTTGSKNSILGRYNGNQGGLDIRTASNYIVLSDGDGNPRGYFDNNGDFIVNRQIGSYTTSGFGVFRSGTLVSVANGSTITLSGGSSAQLICVGCGSTGTGATFFANFNVVVSQIGGSASGVSTTDAGVVDIAVYKSAGDNTVTFKNRSGATRVYNIAMFCGSNGGSV